MLYKVIDELANVMPLETPVAILFLLSAGTCKTGRYCTVRGGWRQSSWRVCIQRIDIESDSKILRDIFNKRNYCTMILLEHYNHYFYSLSLFIIFSTRKWDSKLTDKAWLTIGSFMLYFFYYYFWDMAIYIYILK